MPPVLAQPLTEWKASSKQKEATSAKALKMQLHFEKNLHSGIVLNRTELKNFAKKIGWKIDRKSLGQYKDQWLDLAVYHEFRTPRDVKYQAVSGVPRYATVHMDMAFVPTLPANLNDGFNAFVLFVEVNTQQLHAVPCNSKNTKSWMDAIRNMMETSCISSVSSIMADEERALMSDNFKKWLTKEQAVKLYHLVTRSKAHMAERYIKFVRTQFSQVMKATDSRRWVDILQAVIKRHNNDLYPGTRYRRQTIDKPNFNNFLRQKYKYKAPKMSFNVHSINWRTLPKSWVSRIWKFKFNQRVAIANEVLNDSLVNKARTVKAKKAAKAKRSAFKKKSRDGYFANRAFRIADMFVRASEDQTMVQGAVASCLEQHSAFLTAFSFSVYLLREEGQEKLHPGVLYSHELVAIGEQDSKKKKKKKKPVSSSSEEESDSNAPAEGQSGGGGNQGQLYLRQSRRLQSRAKTASN